VETRRVRAVVFDLDGTLVDSAPDLHAAASAMLAGLGRREVTRAEATSFVGNGIERFVARCLEATGRTPDAETGAAALARFRAQYEAAPAALTRPYPGVPELLAALRASGRPLGVCTNKPEAPARAILGDLGLATHFDAVVGGDTLPVLKPHPAPLLHCLAALGADPAEALYVGDSETDAETARAAGVPFALFSGGYRKSPLAAFDGAQVFDDFPALAAQLGLPAGAA
jgi:phosphoglycolate phosphatase